MIEKTDYKVLARTCRPQTFEDVLGQEHVTQTLKNAIAHNRIPHALILSGPRGVGKTSIARIMAKAVNCEKGPTPHPCNTCSNCLEITEGRSLDVREIDGASNRGIDEIRELRDNVNFSPANSLYKIYIIDEVHMLTREAFNALLKTLEEPPSHTIFIFATTEIHKVPATILSRCQSFDLRRISRRQVMTSLGAVAKKEGIQISNRSLAWLAEASDGSLRDALGLLDQAISFAGTDIPDEKIMELLSLADKRFLFLLSEAIFNRQPDKCLTILGEAYYAGLDMKYLHTMLLRHLRNCLLVKLLGPEVSHLDLSAEEINDLAAQVAKVSQHDLQRLLEILLREEEKLKRSHDSRIASEVLLVKMALLPPAIPLEEILERLESLERRLLGQNSSLSASGPTEVGAAQKKEPPGRTQEEPVNNDIESNHRDPWEGFKYHIQKLNPILYSKLVAATFLGFDQGRLRLGFPENYLFLADIKATENMKVLQDSAGQFFPGLSKIVIELLPPERLNNTSVHATSPNNGKNHDLRREALNHPALRKLMDIFSSAEIREIIPRRKNHTTGGKSIDQ